MFPILWKKLVSAQLYINMLELCPRLAILQYSYLDKYSFSHDSLSLHALSLQNSPLFDLGLNVGCFGLYWNGFSVILKGLDAACFHKFVSFGVFTVVEKMFET